jgi:hypothetical protein
VNDVFNNISQKAQSIDYNEKLRNAGEYIMDKKEKIEQSDSFKGFMQTLSTGLESFVKKTEEFFNESIDNYANNDMPQRNRPNQNQMQSQGQRMNNNNPYNNNNSNNDNNSNNNNNNNSNNNNNESNPQNVNNVDYSNLDIKNMNFNIETPEGPNGHIELPKLIGDSNNQENINKDGEQNSNNNDNNVENLDESGNDNNNNNDKP